MSGRLSLQEFLNRWGPPPIDPPELKEQERKDGGLCLSFESNFLLFLRRIKTAAWQRLFMLDVRCMDECIEGIKPLSRGLSERILKNSFDTYLLVQAYEVWDSFGVDVTTFPGWKKQSITANVPEINWTMVLFILEPKSEAA